MKDMTESAAPIEVSSAGAPLKRSRARRVLQAAGLAFAGVVLAAAVFVVVEGSSFDASMARTYDVPVPAITSSRDPAIVSRGKHLVESTAGCAADQCHGADLGGGHVLDLGPIGRYTGPNITTGGLAAGYSDGELARLVRYGVKRDGRSVRFMPVQDFGWLSDDDLSALVSYLRVAPRVDRPNGVSETTALGKVFDRWNLVVLDVARRATRIAVNKPPPPSPTVEYGRVLAHECTTCHGEHLSGGPIPGLPSSVPVPLDLTPHREGLAGWTYQDFDRVLVDGVKPNGQKLDPFMPIDTLSKLDDTEKHALWAYLQSLPPTPFGQR